MKHTLRIKTLLPAIVFAALISVQTFAQTPGAGAGMVEVDGWTDDRHFILKSYSESGAAVYHSVDARSGKSVPAAALPSHEEILSDVLQIGIEPEELDDNCVISPDSKSIIITQDSDLYIYTANESTVKRLTGDKAAEVNVRFSPDGGKIAYTKNRDLYVYDLAGGREIRITADASDKIYNGHASWVYYEEILGRASNYAAFWWSPDGSKIAWLRFDDSDVPVFTLNRLDEADGVHGLIEAVPYPKAGDPNPKVKMGVADIAAGKTTWIKTDNSIDQYIAWPFWTPDSRKLAVQIINRDQNNLDIILADVETGNFTTIYNEQADTWVEFSEDIHVMNDGSGFILRSPKSGWDNLYYYDWNGREICQLTGFEFNVTGIDMVDEQSKTVYFSATGTESTDLHCFSVMLDGKNTLQITRGAGTHSISISPRCEYFIDTWNSLYSQGAIVEYGKNGRLLREIYRFEELAPDNSMYAEPELVRIKTSDGLFDMPAIITRPLNFDESKQYPVVFQVYGGPDSKSVYNRWQSATPSWYAMNGIITVSVDHRGSGHFGKRGLDYMHRNFGKWEILDYADAVKWLREKPFIDPSRMGITGSSYGGYVTLLALTKGADYWTHGVSTAPVTDFRLYDNVYTERYMDTPHDNAEGYTNGSAMTFVRNFKGKLLLNHGDMDDNVHMQNSIQFISKMQDAGKRFEFMLYPGGRHGWGGAKAVHSMNAAYNFWTENFFCE